MISADTMQIIRNDWHSAPFGCRSAVMERWADKLGCSPKSLWRRIDTGRKQRADKGKRKLEGVDDVAWTVAKIKKMAPEHKGEICTEDALSIGIANGLIPPEFAGKESTVNRVSRDMCLHRRKRRIVRFQAERPNQMHHVDASSSDCFYIDRFEEGEPILKLHRGHKIYKNKPVPTRFRPWIYGLADDHSGMHVARYVAAQGESAIDNLDFMVWVWSDNGETQLFGIPEKLKGDLGPMMRGPEAKEFFARLGVEIDPSLPENKEAHGKIERPWRTMWQRFERPFFVEDMKTFEISMSELNRRFMIYQERYNRKPHRFERRTSRLRMWQRIMQQGGPVAIPQDAMQTVARRYERTVGQDGVFWLDNHPYEVKGLHDAKVWVFKGITDGKLIVQDQRSGEKYDVEDFAPNPLGTFKSPKDSAHIKAIKAGEILKAESPLKNTLYNKEEELPENVTLFPVRSRKMEPENPMKIGGAYPSLESGMKDFCAVSGCFLPFGSEERQAIEGLILDSGLNREYTRRLALDILEENERQVKVG